MNNDKQIRDVLLPLYGSRQLRQEVPKYKIPANEMDAKTAYELVHDQLMLDGNSRLNLATFVTTWMEPEARTLMSDTFDKNMIDKDEYPQTAEIESRCVHMLADLWNCPEQHKPIGCSTTGSSEACMLAGLAMKWRWRQRQQHKNKPHDRPNLVMGINVQICWEKFCRYWDIEMRMVPMEEGRYIISPDLAIDLCDENTIGIVGILGSTFTGEYEDIQLLNDKVDNLNQRTEWNIPIHVDGASGGFVAPFIQPEITWDFRLKWVKSINASGHKFGLVYPGVGWVVWRDEQDLPKDLIFNVNYLGGQMPTFALNFSRPGNQIIAQYYNFLRLGFDGYKNIHQACQEVALYLSGNIEKLGHFDIISRGTDLPVVAWKMTSAQKFSVFDLTERLRQHGWLIPAYTLPENLTEIAICRIVIKEGMSMELAELLLNHIKLACSYFTSDKKSQSVSGFHH
jgi:glutamate decarboxylase